MDLKIAKKNVIFFKFNLLIFMHFYMKYLSYFYYIQ